MTEIYFNLRKLCFSLRVDGIVREHATTVILENVTFKVQQGGRERVIREQQKNVHAFICGDVLFTDRHWEHVYEDGAAMATYNPYKYSTFVMADAKTPIFKAKKVLLTGRRIYILEA